MANPQISFRLSPYQLARGLKIIRALEPNYQPSSVAQIVKLIYIDYISKMSLQKDLLITEQDLDEIRHLLEIKSSALTFDDFLDLHEKAFTPTETTSKEETSKTPPKEILPNFNNLKETKSIIKSVSDFSPPEEWLE